jgi:hypothetical protein
MEQITTTTPKNTCGINISYSDEMTCANSLIKLLPKGWKIHFSWCQILFSDVQYRIERKKKLVSVVYNQNLRYWWAQCEKEIVAKVKKEYIPAHLKKSTTY